MARFEDYVKKDDQIEQEIEQAAEETEERRATVPDSVVRRFEGKSLEDVMESYANLERRFSEQGNKMGELRKSFDDYILLQSQRSEPEPVQDEPVTSNDLYDDPETAISKVVERKTKDKLSELEEQLKGLRLERSRAQLEKTHNVQEILSDPNFIDWVKAKPFRVRLAQQADQYDFEAADELFSLYEDHLGARKTKSQRRREVAAASLETGSAEQTKLDETISRSDIIDAKIAAKRGNRQAEEWLKANSAKIAAAYGEGRVVD